MILKVDNIHFSYNSHPVLRDVTFEARAGELLAILGPNGVGKTTLLKCINGLHKAGGGNGNKGRGAIYVDGENVLRMRPGEIARNIGYVAQHSETARLTVFDAVLMGRKPHIRWSVSEKDIRMVDAALKRLGLEHLSLRHIDNLSGGELQKVCLARALVQEPRLLLLDEPTSSLDLRNQVDMLSMLRHVVEDHGMAAVMTMHDLNTALRFAHKFLFLKSGKIFAAGETGEVTGEMVQEVYGLPVEIHLVNDRPMVVPIH